MDTPITSDHNFHEEESGIYWGLPQCAYTSNKIFESEIEEIFSTQWILVARQGIIPRAFDYFEFEINGKPFFIIRQKSGSIKAFANFCIHRYSKLVTGTGNAENISCPYHGWTYGPQGHLQVAPYVAEIKNHPITDKKLIEFPCEIWNGFIFVTLDKQATSISTKLNGLSSGAGLCRLDAFVDEHFGIRNWDANWKLVVENFIESYHLSFVHSRSLGKITSTSSVKQGPRDPNYFTSQFNNFLSKQPLEDLPAPALVAGVFPNGLLSPSAEMMWWMSVNPINARTTQTRWGLSFSPHLKKADNYQEMIARAKDDVLAIMDEDSDIVRMVQQGCCFDSNMRGRLHNRLDSPIVDFHIYLNRLFKKL